MSTNLSQIIRISDVLFITGIEDLNKVTKINKKDEITEIVFKKTQLVNLPNNLSFIDLYFIEVSFNEAPIFSKNSAS